MKRSTASFLLALPVALSVFWLISTSRAATETPDYMVVRAEDKFEIRDYPRLAVATTPMEEGEMNRGFRQLFSFITGRNGDTQKIEMTTPVLIDPEMKTMSFIMPKKAVENGVPKPTDERVTLGKLEAARFAVCRFAGGRTQEKDAIEKLKTWIELRKLSAKGAPLFAYYDPPWTPVLLRRNEVLIRLDRRQD
ncbi:MAG: hypothetical protein JWL59_3176 [Chthoniobacteraceae bacterium]|nr:hypothetical protein [Chthoniobacteraceae bacterium]